MKTNVLVKTQIRRQTGTVSIPHLVDICKTCFILDFGQSVYKNMDSMSLVHTSRSLRLVMVEPVSCNAAFIYIVYCVSCILIRSSKYRNKLYPFSQLHNPHQKK